MKKKPRIVLASDCPPCGLCGEAYCKKHRKHYADCACKGPHSEPDECMKRIELGHHGSILTCFLEKGHKGDHRGEGVAQGVEVYKISWPNKRKGS